MIARPTDLTARLVKYEDVEEPLIRTAFDVLDGRPEMPATEGLHSAVVMRFKLGVSSYATMLLREILRSDSSSAHQSTLNQKDAEQ
jgi:tRNA pseudouridine13 synthase